MKQAILYEKQDENIIKCLLCSHYCEIKPGQAGTCLLRKNVDGELYTYSYGASTGFAIDPIEKKPFYHFKPGSKVLSFGTPGCNFKCLNCQNWQLSHVKRNTIEQLTAEYPPSLIAELAIKNNVDGIAYTYSEPTIFFEYARDTILECRKNYPDIELFHIFISNGFMSKETIQLIKNEKLISAINIDLKFINSEKYKKICHASLQPVLDNIKRFQDLSDFIHMEIINLVIPGENDTEEDFEKLSQFIFSVNPEIPVHFSRFHPANKLQDKPATDLKTLFRAKQIAEETGLKYIYIGNTNLPDVENTYCPNCKTLLINRNMYSIKVQKWLGIDVCRPKDQRIEIQIDERIKAQIKDSTKKLTTHNSQLITKNGICLKCEQTINIRL
ncbi:MAG: AmmeMemoRadiSam system radical SAM enzyme [bacterium]